MGNTRHMVLCATSRSDEPVTRRLMNGRGLLIDCGVTPYGSPSSRWSCGVVWTCRVHETFASGEHLMG